MRIIAGEWRGRPLIAPAGSNTRPTADRAREGLFSMLASRLGSLEGLQVADLFAGSGALGLEALSRGAAHCLFVDNDRAAVEAIKRNLVKLNASARGDVRAQSVERAALPSAPCDLVMLDPPYSLGLAESALERLCTGGWLAAGAIVSVETSGPELAPPGCLQTEAVRKFGKAHIHLLRHLG